MTDKVVNIADHRKPPPDEREFVCTLDIFYQEGDGYTAHGRDFEDDSLEVTDRLLKWADACDDISWILRQQAAELGDDDNRELMTVHIFEGGNVRTAVNDDKIVTPAQVAWVEAQLDVAKGTIEPVPEEA